jgi:hypothetical protein
MRFCAMSLSATCARPRSHARIQPKQSMEPTAGRSYRRFEFNKRSQLFMGTHDETLTVGAIRVSNEDR